MNTVQTTQVKNAILAFIKSHEIELPAESPALSNFIDRALHYLSVSETLQSFAVQKAIVTGQLVPAEKESRGSFSFVLEHNLDPAKGATTPTIQVSGTRKNFHALIIKQQDVPLDGYERQQPIEIFGRQYHIGLVVNRVRSAVDLAEEFPALHKLKEECRAEGRPVIGFLGSVRQSPHPHAPHTCETHNQTKAVSDIFSILEDRLNNNVMICAGGWAGSEEGSFGIPRLSYLHAVTRQQPVLATLPQAGMLNRHENPTLEILSGQEWGDDSAVLAAACDAAFVFSPYGTWTKIEIENLLAQTKPFAVVDNPDNRQLAPGEKRREITASRGSYFLYANAADAAHNLLHKLAETGCTRPVRLTHYRQAEASVD